MAHYPPSIKSIINNNIETVHFIQLEYTVFSCHGGILLLLESCLQVPFEPS